MSAPVILAACHLSGQGLKQTLNTQTFERTSILNRVPPQRNVPQGASRP